MIKLNSAAANHGRKGTGRRERDRDTQREKEKQLGQETNWKEDNGRKEER